MRKLLYKKFSTSDNDRGFTLIELLIVVIILGILAGTVITQISGARTAAIAKTCKSDAAETRAALDAYFLDSGAYPTTTGAATNYVTADMTRSNTISGATYTLAPGYVRLPGPILIGDTATKDYYLKISITAVAGVVSDVGTMQGYLDSAGTKIIADCIIR